jgi:hypothetical protein
VIPIGLVRFVFAAAVLLAVASTNAGCGDGEDRSQPSPSPELLRALSYLPPDAGAAASLATDLDRGPLAEIDRQLSAFKAWIIARQDIENAIAEDLDFGGDLRPQLGSPAVGSASTFDENDEQDINVLQIKNPSTMRAALLRSVSSGKRKRLSNHKGAVMVQDKEFDPDEAYEFTGLHRDILIQADSARPVRAAIDRSASDDNLASDKEVASELAGVGHDSLFRITGDLATLLSNTKDRDAIAARKVPWVGALGRFTVAGFVDDDGLRITATLTSERKDLPEAELPLASGGEPARLHAPDSSIAFGLREPAQLQRFFVRAAETSGSKDLREYAAAFEQLRAVGIDFNKDFLDPIRNVSVGVEGDDNGSFQATLRSGSSADFRDVLDGFDLLVKSVVGEAIEVDPDRVIVDSTGDGENRIWTIRTGRKPIARYTVRSDSLLGGIGTSPIPKSAEASFLSGAEGAFAMKLSGVRFADLVREIDKEGGEPDLSDKAGRALLRVLGQLGGFSLTVRLETSAMTTTARVFRAPQR